MRKFLLALAFGLCVAPIIDLGAGRTASAKEAAQLADIAITTLAVQVTAQENGFTVVDSRMDETATAGFFFGIVGATVNSAINNAEDDAKAEPLKPTAAAIDVRSIVAQTITTRLAARPTVPLANPSEGASHKLVVDIGEWGLVRKSQGPDQSSLRTFLKMNISILDGRGRRVWGEQREHSVGQMAADLSVFTPEVFKTEMEALAVRAGQQVANKIIYR